MLPFGRVIVFTTRLVRVSMTETDAAMKSAFAGPVGSRFATKSNSPSGVMAAATGSRSTAILDVSLFESRSITEMLLLNWLHTYSVRPSGLITGESGLWPTVMEPSIFASLGFTI